MQLTLNELAYIGTLIEGHSDMSFFKQINTQQSGEEKQSLEAKGFFKGGRLSGPLQEASLVMAKATKSARVVMRVSSGVLEKGVYTLGDLQVMVETFGSNIEVSFYEGFDKVRMDMSEHIGLSLAQHTNLKVMLDAKPLLVLLSIVDWIRRDALRGYVGEAPKEIMLEKDYATYIQKPMENSLSGLMATFYGIGHIHAEDYEAFKPLLIEKGLIRIDEGVVQFDQEFLLFATHFLLPDTQTVLEAIDARHSERIVTTSQIILSAGIKDNVAFHVTGEGIEMTTISSAELLSRAEQFLKCPDLE